MLNVFVGGGGTASESSQLTVALRRANTGVPGSDTRGQLQQQVLGYGNEFASICFFFGWGVRGGSQGACKRAQGPLCLSQPIRTLSSQPSFLAFTAQDRWVAPVEASTNNEPPSAATDHLWHRWKHGRRGWDETGRDKRRKDGKKIRQRVYQYAMIQFYPNDENDSTLWRPKSSHLRMWAKQPFFEYLHFWGQQNERLKKAGDKDECVGVFFMTKTWGRRRLKTKEKVLRNSDKRLRSFGASLHIGCVQNHPLVHHCLLQGVLCS